jgi:hypothetical protein
MRLKRIQIIIATASFMLVLLVSAIIAPENETVSVKQASDLPLQIELIEAVPSPVIDQDHPELTGNKYGFEGGSAFVHQGEYHLFTAEMAGDPFWVTMRLAHWKSDDLIQWHRMSTVLESKGEGFEKDQLYSIWQPNLIYNKKEQRWNLFFTAYQGQVHEGDGTHMNGHNRRLVSLEPGPGGLNGPWKDMGSVFNPDENSGPWEGQQGTTSIYPYKVGNRWYSFYNSHNYDPISPWYAGMATAPDIAGPWKRYGEETPSPIEPKFIENPIVKEIGDYFVVIYDSGIIKGENEYQNDPIQVGYSVSRNGLDWPTGARLAVRDISDKENWAEDVRTPLGLIPMEDGTYSLLYTAKKKGEQFWAIGLSRVRIVQNPSEVK